MTDNIVTMANFSLKGINLFVDFDDIHRLIVMNKKKIMAVIKNNAVLENMLIKKICENPNASNHK